jgi:hypothetical protein
MLSVQITVESPTERRALEEMASMEYNIPHLLRNRMMVERGLDEVVYGFLLMFKAALHDRANGNMTRQEDVR